MEICEGMSTCRHFWIGSWTMFASAPRMFVTPPDIRSAHPRNNAAPKATRISYWSIKQASHRPNRTKCNASTPSCLVARIHHYPCIILPRVLSPNSKLPMLSSFQTSVSFIFHPPDSRQSLIPPTIRVRRPVRKQVVDDQTADGEEEDEQRPEELVQGRARRLDHLDCFVSAFFPFCGRGEGGGVPNTIMSRTKTISPRMPPPVPYCHELPAVEAVTSPVGRADVKVARRRWERRRRVVVISAVVWWLVLGVLVDG